MQMNRATRRKISTDERRELWRRWAAGESASEIARVLGRWRNDVQQVVERQGGYVPALRKRAGQQLTLAQREEISRGISAEHSLRYIAERIGKDHSTVSREIKRNGGRCGFRATLAEHAAWRRARRPKRCLLQQNARLCRYV